MDAGGAEVMETFEVSALALPVADGEVDEVELRDVAKIGDRKNGRKDRLQAGIVTLGWQLIHLQESLVRAALDFNEVRNTDSGWDLRKVETAANRAVLVRHSLLLRTREARKKSGCSGQAARFVGLIQPRSNRSASFGMALRYFGYGSTKS
jgi:hypothetical protein